MNAEILEIVLATVVPAVAVLLAWCAKWLTAIIKAKTEEIKTKSDNETLVTYVDLVSDNAINVVSSLNQTLVEGLKAASADGKLTLDDAKMIKDQAVHMLTDTLSEDIKNVLSKAFGDIEIYLGIVIERAVVALKEKNS